MIAGVIQRLSVSQLKRHKLCPRAWFFQKVMRVPEPSTGAQQVGTEGHAQLEHFLATGEDVLGSFARAGAHLLPTPGPDLLVEQPLNGAPPLTARGIPFTGFIDLVDARRLASDGVLRITDHKFTSNVASNAASAEQLADADTEPGLQMVGYGAWALSQVERFPGLRTLELEHFYYQTRGQRLAASVVATVPAEHVEREWQTKVAPQVEAMKEHAQAARASDVPANYGPACGKYGGCPFMAKCLTGENKTMSLRDKLLNKASESVPLSVAAVERNAPELPAVLPPDAPAPTPVQTAPEVAQATEQPAPKRRGRPRKVAESEQPTDAAPSPASSLRVLFVDCIPTTFDGPTPESLTSYVDTMHRKVAEAGGVDDVRFAGSDSALGFGKWRGALAMAARAELPAPGSYVALGVAQSELMQVIVEALEPAFDVVVRGARQTGRQGSHPSRKAFWVLTKNTLYTRLSRNTAQNLMATFLIKCRNMRANNRHKKRIYLARDLKCPLQTLRPGSFITSVRCRSPVVCTNQRRIDDARRLRIVIILLSPQIIKVDRYRLVDKWPHTEQISFIIITRIPKLLRH